jgi:hypothetical protein
LPSPKPQQTNRYTTPWTDEKIDILKQAHLDGLSLEQTAKKLGKGFTFNAVASKRKKLGLRYDGRRTGPYPNRIGSF